jgi:hypothetical protein
MHSSGLVGGSVTGWEQGPRVSHAARSHHGSDMSARRFGLGVYYRRKGGEFTWGIAGGSSGRGCFTGKPGRSLTDDRATRR